MTPAAPRHPASVAVVVADHRLGQLRWSDGRLIGIDLLPAAEAALATARDRGPVWLAVPAGEVDRKTLSSRLPGLAGTVSVGEGEEGVSRALRQVAAASGSVGVIAAADRVARAAAVGLGWTAVPDPAMVAWVLDGHRPVLAWLDDNHEALDRLPHLLVCQRDAGAVLAFTTDRSLAAAAAAGAQTCRLGLDPGTEDAVWVRTRGLSPRAGQRAVARRRILATVPGAALLAVGAKDDLSDRALHGDHGHFALLAPSPAAVTWPRPGWPQDVELVRWPWEEIPERVLDPPVLPPPPCDGWAADFAADVQRYAGVQPLDAAGTIASRNVRHPDNDRAVDALLADLSAMGYCPWVHTFTFGGRTVRNVLADLPGRGYYARPRVLEDLRKLLVDPDLLTDAKALAARLETVVGRAVAASRWDAGGEDPAQLLQQLRVDARLHPWLPWWRLRCLLGGLGCRLVVVGCHLDSTAARDGGYLPATSPAPGADDDASGIAGTLAVARWLAGFRGQLRHTVRFGFFNAEEEGLVGSGAYAAWLASFGAPVEAAVLMDMIGHNSDEHRLFEVHAGSTNAAVRDASEPIAHRISAWTTALGQLPAPQIYRGTNPSPGADRNATDGAIGRSDHASFQANGYPAVVVSEDFFANLASEPASDANPSYHRGGDTSVDPAYGAAIACAVAHAVRDIAAHGL